MRIFDSNELLCKISKYNKVEFKSENFVLSIC